MPKKIDPAVKERAVRWVREHRAEYDSLTGAAAAVARKERLDRETVRRWALQAEIDGGERTGPTSEELGPLRVTRSGCLAGDIVGPTIRRSGQLLERASSECVRSPQGRFHSSGGGPG